MSVDQIIAVSVGAAQAIATGFIAYTVYRQTEKLKRIEISKQAIDTYNVLNAIAVSSEANLLTFDRMGRQDIEEDIETRRKRWCAFVWLEALQATFMSMKHNLIDRAYAEQALRQQLQVILNDEDVFWLVCNRGFDPAFAEYSGRIREELQNSHSKKPDAETERGAATKEQERKNAERVVVAYFERQWL